MTIFEYRVFIFYFHFDAFKSKLKVPIQVIVTVSYTLWTIIIVIINLKEWEELAMEDGTFPGPGGIFCFYAFQNFKHL